MIGKKNVAANRIACSMVISKIFLVFSTNVDSSLENALASKPKAQEATDSIVNFVESWFKKTEIEISHHNIQYFFELTIFASNTYPTLDFCSI